MELVTTSILTLLALYVIYSEPFKLPAIIKKNKKLSYGLIIGLYLYYYQNNVVEGSGAFAVAEAILAIIGAITIFLVISFVLLMVMEYNYKGWGWEGGPLNWMASRWRTSELGDKFHEAIQKK